MGYAFKYVAGILVTVGVKFTDGYLFTFNYGSFSTWNVQIATQTNDIVVNFNLVAMALIIFINKLKNKILLEQEMQVLTIGEEVVHN